MMIIQKCKIFKQSAHLGHSAIVKGYSEVVWVPAAAESSADFVVPGSLSLAPA